MTVTIPKVYDVTLTDEEQGVVLRFKLDENLEPSEEFQFMIRARIKGSSYYQPLFYSVLNDGITGETIIEPGKIDVDYADNPSVDIEWYMEKYPEREKSEITKKTLSFEIDWFGMSMFDHELRASFERMGIEMQAQEACRYPMAVAEDIYKEAVLDNSAGLWLNLQNGDTVGIALDQPDFGQAWLKAWIPQVLNRSREIRVENGWDDGQIH